MVFKGVWFEADTGAVNQGICEIVRDRGMGTGFMYDLEY